MKDTAGGTPTLYGAVHCTDVHRAKAPCTDLQAEWKKILTKKHQKTKGKDPSS